MEKVERAVARELVTMLDDGAQTTIEVASDRFTGEKLQMMAMHFDDGKIALGGSPLTAVGRGGAESVPPQADSRVPPSSPGVAVSVARHCCPWTLHRRR